MKECAFCKKELVDTAIRCRYCHRSLSKEETAKEPFTATFIPIERFSINVKNKLELFNAIEHEYGAKTEDSRFKISKVFGSARSGFTIVTIGQIKGESVDITIRPSYLTIAGFLFCLIIGICILFFINKIPTKNVGFRLFYYVGLVVFYGHTIFKVRQLSKEFKNFLLANGINNFALFKNIKTN